ncbi:MAG: hypothetical protein WBW92_10425 [Rhodanobacteraceae bacterium]
MTDGLLLTTLASGFGIAFLHTLIPVHWLPYVLVGRARGWSLSHTLAVNVAGGVGHVLMTALLGALAMFVGVHLDGLTRNVFPWLVAGLLLLVGLYFLYRQFAGHTHDHGVSEDHPALSEEASDRAATLALVTMLLLSPCEAFVPIYLTDVTEGLAGFLFLTAVLAVSTISCMLLLTSLAWRGMVSPKMAGIKRWQSGLVGAMLIVLALVMAVWRP